MLMDSGLDANQQDYAETAHASGKDLITLINEVLDQAKIESGRLELEAVPFDLRSALDKVLSLFSGKSHEKGIEVRANLSIAHMFIYFFLLGWLLLLLNATSYLNLIWMFFWASEVGHLHLRSSA